MKYIIIIILLFGNNCIFGQFEYRVWRTDLTDLSDIVEKEIEYWNDGTKRIENIKEGDKIFRYQYFEEGQLEFYSEIVQIEVNDTFKTINQATNEVEVIINKGNSDMLIGPFESYYKIGNIKESGEWRNSYRYGNWKLYSQDGILLKDYNYDENGKLMGEYKDYYDNGKLKSEGTYTTVPQEIERRIYKAEMEADVIIKETVNVEIKTGIWKYYDEQGEIIELKTEN